MSPSQRPRPWPSRHPATRTARNPPTKRIEVVFLPGLGQIVESEVREAIQPGALRRVAGRADSFLLDYDGPWDRLLKLRTVVAAFAVLAFPVPRPRGLLGDQHFTSIAETIGYVRGVDPLRPPASFRFDAAGRASGVFQRLASQLQDATGLRYDKDDGDLVLRFRRAVETTEGWEVLVRISARPLSQRGWRVRNVPGAVDASVAAAVAALTRPRPSDRIVNLMCGSGSLLIERLLAAPAAVAVGVDRDGEVLGACEENLLAAGLRESVSLLHEDVAAPGWKARGPFDVVLADPPWGNLVGDHSTNEAVHLALLQHAHAGAAHGARMAVLTHEIRLMERSLRRLAHLWELVGTTRVFQKGQNPRIYLLRFTSVPRPGA